MVIISGTGLLCTSTIITFTPCTSHHHCHMLLPSGCDMCAPQSGSAHEEVDIIEEDLELEEVSRILLHRITLTQHAWHR